MNSILVRHKWEPYVWLLPSILLMTIFVVFPIGIVFKLAFSEISKAGIVGGFIGFDNFKAAVSAPVFGTVMLNTVVWVVSVVGLSTLLGFIVAMTLNQKFHGRKLARSVVVFPWATSLVIQASVWNYIIKYEYGNLNNVLLNLGIIQDAINWRATYQIEFAWECGVGIFVTIPFVTFCVLWMLAMCSRISFMLAMYLSPHFLFGKTVLHKFLCDLDDLRLLIVAELAGLLDGIAQRALRLAKVLQERGDKCVKLLRHGLLKNMVQPRDEQDDLLILLVGVELLLPQHAHQALTVG